MQAAPSQTTDTMNATAGNSAGQSKLFLNPAGLNSAGDRSNHTTLWRRPDVGSMYRNTEHIAGPTTQPLLDCCGLTEARIAALETPVEVLDMCCGAGVVSAYVHAALMKAGLEGKGFLRLTCADSSAAQLEHVRGRIAEDGWVDTKVVQADIAKLPFEDNTFDYVVVGMAIMVVAEPYVGLSGGRIATSTWAVEGWVAETHEAVASLALPGQKPVPWPQTSQHLTRTWAPGAWDDEYFVSAMYNAAGFGEIEAGRLTRRVRFESPEHFCAVLEGLEVAIVERYWSREQMEKLKAKVTPAIVEYMRKKYGGKAFDVERSVILASGTKPL